MFNQFDQDEFDREFASASARIKQAQKERAQIRNDRLFFGQHRQRNRA